MRWHNSASMVAHARIGKCSLSLYQRVQVAYDLAIYGVRYKAKSQRLRLFRATMDQTLPWIYDKSLF
jgi:hypothetical protein